MRTTESSSGREQKISLALCLPSNRRAWRDVSSLGTRQNTTSEEIIKAFGLWIPTHNQSPTKGLTLDEPFYVQLSALLFGKLRGDGLKIAILARLDALPVFTIRIDDTGIQMGFASDNKEAPMAVDVAQIGQVEIAPVGQEHIALQALGRRPVVVFGIGIRTQGNGDGGILKQI